ncbi:MAG: PEP-CTERM sorting domain-containing protein [Acidobacteriaceae bacterium]|nr:PEP-CTERM sorting domain-containing protein [Acidobacteriaceae bacterium]
MQNTISRRFCALLAIVLTLPVIARADAIGVDDLVTIQNGTSHPNSPGLPLVFSSRSYFPAPPESPSSSTMPANGRVVIPVVVGATTTNLSFVGPVALCETAPIPSPSPAPEPGTLVLLGSGLLIFGFRRHRRVLREYT